MQELIQRLMQQAHLSQAQAQQVVNVALNFIRSRVPALAPYLGALGGTTTGIAPTSSASTQGGGMLGNIEGMLGGGSTSAPMNTGAPAAQGGGGMLGGIEGALGGLFSANQGGLHQELVQNAGLNQTQAASSVNVIQGFITQHVPAASSMMQEGSALDNVEDKVDNLLGIKDNQTNK
jgi:hypothetical protein